MEHTIRLDGDLLRVHMWGRKDDVPPSSVCKAALEECGKHKLKRILVELTQEKALSHLSQYLLVDRLRQFGCTHEHRIALVHHTPGLYEACDMIELVAENRGLHVRNFRDVPSALRWLESSDH
jgi:hypothetical protein